MAPLPVTVAPLAEHLPGWLLLLGFVALVCVTTTLATAAGNWLPGKCGSCGQPLNDGHRCGGGK